MREAQDQEDQRRPRQDFRRYAHHQVDQSEDCSDEYRKSMK